MENIWLHCKLKNKADVAVPVPKTYFFILGQNVQLDISVLDVLLCIVKPVIYSTVLGLNWERYLGYAARLRRTAEYAPSQARIRSPLFTTSIPSLK